MYPWPEGTLPCQVDWWFAKSQLLRSFSRYFSLFQHALSGMFREWDLSHLGNQQSRYVEFQLAELKYVRRILRCFTLQTFSACWKKENWNTPLIQMWHSWANLGYLMVVDEAYRLALPRNTHYAIIKTKINHSFSWGRRNLYMLFSLNYGFAYWRVWKLWASETATLWVARVLADEPNTWKEPPSSSFLSRIIYF